MKVELFRKYYVLKLKPTCVFPKNDKYSCFTILRFQKLPRLTTAYFIA